MASQLLAPVLTVVVGYLLRLALNAIKVEIDEKIYNSIVAGIVVFLLSALGVEVARNLLPNTFS